MFSITDRLNLEQTGADPELVSRGGGAHVERPSRPLPHSSPPSLLCPFPILPLHPSLSLPSPPLEEGGPGVLPRKILKF